jgi:hypothetical protein
VVSTKDGVHERRFASAETPDNHQIESVFCQPREQITAFGLQDFVIVDDACAERMMSPIPNFSCS